MSQEDIKADISSNALSICQERIRTNSKVGLPDILEIIRVQLQWLVDFFEGRRQNERNRLHDIKLGHFALRELNERDVEFINALSKAQYVASQTAAGLKLDMKVLNDDS